MQMHRACANCGTYRKHEVLNVNKKLDKKTKAVHTNNEAAKADKKEKKAAK
jgi:hypothetical protein